jgi:hypothetical protein
VGSLALDLSLPDSAKFATFSYTIAGTGFSRTGTVDVSNSSGVSVLVDAVPFGSGYTATLTGSSTSSPEVDCAGEATFDVTSAMVTTVPVHVLCHEQAAPPPPPPPPAQAVPIPTGANAALGLLMMAAGCLLIRRPGPDRRRSVERDDGGGPVPR